MTYTVLRFDLNRKKGKMNLLLTLKPSSKNISKLLISNMQTIATQKNYLELILEICLTRLNQVNELV